MSDAGIIKEVARSTADAPDVRCSAGGTLSDFERVLRDAKRSGNTLTASPLEHIKRARQILDRGNLSELLYAALELRFALERITQLELIFADDASKKMLDDYSASKKVLHLRRLAPESEFPHDIEMRHAVTGEWSKIGEYRPIDQRRVAGAYGRLGDLLHAKDALALGMPETPWYRETYEFLAETCDFLRQAYEDNDQFYAYQGLDHIRMVRRD